MPKSKENSIVQGNLNQYVVVGRPIPTESNPKPNVYRMRIFAKDEVCAKSRFYYFVSKLKRLKKAHGEILSVTKVFERKTNRVKNYSIFLRYNSRSGTHNMNKEYRDVSAVGAVNQLYHDMASRHRARFSSIQVIDVKEVAASECRRPKITQFHDSKIRFPVVSTVPRVHKSLKSTFVAHRPNTFA